MAGVRSAGIAIVLAAVSFGTAAFAQRDVLGPRGASILSPVAIECIVLSDGGRAEIHVRNSTGQTLQAGRKVHWKASSGDQRIRGLPNALIPGATVQIDRSRHSTSCSAMLLRPDPVFSQ